MVSVHLLLISSVAIATPNALLHFCLTVRQEEEKKEKKEMCSVGAVPLKLSYFH